MSFFAPFCPVFWTPPFWKPQCVFPGFFFSPAFKLSGRDPGHLNWGLDMKKLEKRKKDKYIHRQVLCSNFFALFLQSHRECLWTELTGYQQHLGAHYTSVTKLSSLRLGWQGLRAVLTGGLRRWRSQPHPLSPGDGEIGLSTEALDGRRPGAAWNESPVALSLWRARLTKAAWEPQASGEQNGTCSVIGLFSLKAFFYCSALGLSFSPQSAYRCEHPSSGRQHVVTRVCRARAPLGREGTCVNRARGTMCLSDRLWGRHCPRPRPWWWGTMQALFAQLPLTFPSMAPIVVLSQVSLLRRGHGPLTRVCRRQRCCTGETQDGEKFSLTVKD